ncbi:MAG: hypothetical protein WAN48_06150 [Actinomycetes bacterium]
MVRRGWVVASVVAFCAGLAWGAPGAAAVSGLGRSDAATSGSAAASSAIPVLDPTFSGDGRVRCCAGLYLPGMQFSDVATRGGWIYAVGTAGDQSRGTSWPLVAAFRGNGTLAGSFSSRGFRLVRRAGDQAEFDSLVVEPDGKIVAAGIAGRNVLVSRFRADGTLDPTFARDGVRLLRVRVAGTNAVVSLDGGDRILVADSRTDTFASSSDALVWRLTGQGALDRTFARDGRKEIDQVRDDLISDMVVDARGRPMVLLVDFRSHAPGRVVRLRTGGALDTSFSESGTLRFRMAPHGDTWPMSISLDGSGRIVVGMWGSDGLGVARWLPNGQPDASYGTNGQSRASCSVTACAVLTRGGVLTPDGYVFAGTSDWSSLSPSYLARFSPTGGFDATFGNAGEFIHYLWPNAYDEMSLRPIVDARGRLLVAGYAGFGTQQEPPVRATLVRLIAH